MTEIRIPKKRVTHHYSIPARSVLKLRKIVYRIPDWAGVTRRLHKSAAKDRPDALFIWIPKTAGTSLVEALNIQTYLDLHSARFQFPQHGTVTFGHMNVQTLVNEGLIVPEFIQSAFTFSVVRNPYARAVSLFRYLLRMKDLPETCTFDDFCHLLIKRGCEPVGLYNFQGLSQCNPQAYWLEGMEPDHLLHIEQLEAGIPPLFQRLGISESKELPVRNKSSGRPWPSYYTDTSFRLIREFYSRDFERFGYSDELPKDAD